jgi:hypothetical protein
VVQDRLFIVMDLADGSLSDRATQCRALGLPGIPVDELVRYMGEAAEALDYLHGERVHHRDIKPANVLLLQGHARLADFGLARVLQPDNVLTTATMCGTPGFMAPEVYQGLVSPHSDQWSLAMTYAELRLGRRVFKSRDIFGLSQEMAAGQMDLGNLPGPEQDVLRKAMAPRPEERYASCGEFALALRAAVPAPPLTPVPLVPKLPAAADTKELKTDPTALPLAEPIFQQAAAGRPRRTWVERAALAACLVLLCAMAVVLWYSLPMPWLRRGPRIEFPASMSVVVDTGGQKTGSFKIKRRNYDGPIQIVLAKETHQTIEISPRPVKAGDSEVMVDVEVKAAARPGVNQILLEARVTRDGEATIVGRFQLDLTVLFLPPDCTKKGEPIPDGRGIWYYPRINWHPDDKTSVPFVLIPAKEGDELGTFYIMENKVSLGLYSQFNRKHDPWWLKGPVEIPLWDRGGRYHDHPVLGVTGLEALAFATWVPRGWLPTLAQWNRASGFDEKPPPGEGPYQGKWYDGRKDIAVGGLPDSLPLDKTPGDVSMPYKLKNMSGNGHEWTRTSLPGRPDRWYLRGRGYTQTHLTYERMEEDKPAWDRTQASDDYGFRVVIQP